MGRLVANLLDMIRVEAGALQVQKEWQLLSDVVGRGAAPHRGPAPRPSGRRRPSRRTFRWCRWTRSCWSRCSSTCSRMPPSTRRPARRSRSAPRRSRARSSSYVADRGPGLPPGEEERIFEQVPSRRRAARAASASASPSAAASSPRTAGASGPRTAPGAARCSASRCRSRGTPPQLVTEARAEARMEPARDRPGPLVLLIEDEPQMRRFLRTALGANDYRLVEAETGRRRASRRRRPGTPTSSCSTSGSPTATGSR